MTLPRYFLSKFSAGLIAVLLAGTIALGLTAIYFMPSLPDISDEQTFQLKIPLRIYSSDNQLIGEYSEERRIPLNTSSTPRTLINAVLAAEDAEFYSHHGVAIKGLIRAALSNYRAGGKSQGASTITMQVARNFFLSPKKTYTRKIKEILLALKIERQLSKDEILELYLNKIFLGHRAYGFGAAAKVYYGKDINDLTLPEFAMLAGLPKAPSRNNPLSRPDNAKDRRDYVLGRMHKLEMISDEEYETAIGTSISASRHVKKVEHEAPYIAEMARQYVIEKHGDSAYESGLNVYTSLDTRKQEAAQTALQKGLLAFTRRHGYRGPSGKLDPSQLKNTDSIVTALTAFPSVGPLIPAVVTGKSDHSISATTYRGNAFSLKYEDMKWAMTRAQTPEAIPASKLSRGDVLYVEPIDENNWQLAQVPEVGGAFVSLRPDDGAILALTGGFSYYQSKYNRATQAQRQPGSNIKPFIYSAALEHGFTPATPVSGAPIVVHDETTGEDWRPENYNKKFVGLVPTRTALAKSMNLVSIRILRSIGVDTAIRHLGKFGFDTSRLPHNLSLALGTASLTPLEVATGFAEFANTGVKLSPWFIDRIEDSKGDIVEQHTPTPVCTNNPIDENPAQDSDVSSQAAPQTAGCRPRIISPENAFLMTSMMQSVIQFGTGSKAKELGRTDLSGKTGTTNEQKDAWFSGFNPDIQATAWVGFDQPKPMGRAEFGGRAALPIWMDYMKVALQGVPNRTLIPPPGIASHWVNKNSGEPTWDGDPDGTIEYFISAESDSASEQSPGQVEFPVIRDTIPVTPPPAHQDELF